MIESHLLNLNKSLFLPVFQVYLKNLLNSFINLMKKTKKISNQIILYSQNFIKKFIIL